MQIGPLRPISAVTDFDEVVPGFLDFASFPCAQGRSLQFLWAIYLYKIIFGRISCGKLSSILDVSKILHDKNALMKILEEKIGPSSHVQRNFRCAWCREIMRMMSSAGSSDENYGMCSECLNHELSRLGLRRARVHAVSVPDRVVPLPMEAIP